MIRREVRLATGGAKVLTRNKAGTGTREEERGGGEGGSGGHIEVAPVAPLLPRDSVACLAVQRCNRCNPAHGPAEAAILVEPDHQRIGSARARIACPARRRPALPRRSIPPSVRPWSLRSVGWKVPDPPKRCSRPEQGLVRRSRRRVNARCGRSRRRSGSRDAEEVRGVYARHIEELKSRRRDPDDA